MAVTTPDRGARTVPPGFYDVALRDFGLMLGALALARLAVVYDPPLRGGRR